MGVYKRGKVYWFEFYYNGKRYRQSTRLRNFEKAKNVEAAFRTNLALAEAGLQKIQPEPEPVAPEPKPTFSGFA